MGGLTRGLGCLLLLAVIAVIGVEVIVFYEASRWLNRTFESAIGSGGWLICLIWTIAALMVGIRLGRYHVSRIMVGMLNGTAGRHLVGLIGAVLLGLPGLLTDIPGILLLLPPIQIWLGRLGAKVMASVVKRTMGKMMGGGFPGMAGGFPGMGGGFPGMGAGGFPGRFPGMQPMKPDDRTRFPKPGKTYDTTADRE